MQTKRKRTGGFSKKTFSEPTPEVSVNLEDDQIDVRERVDEQDSLLEDCRVEQLQVVARGNHCIRQQLSQLILAPQIPQRLKHSNLL